MNENLIFKSFLKVRHYGALGEDILGYEDPNKDLRKAVKAKEKAAKKARKAKKKKTGKKDDLFDPENLAKFKAELEERKRREAEFAAAAADSDSDKEQLDGATALKAEDKEKDSDKESDKGDIKFILDTQNETNSAQSSKAVTPVQLQSPLEPIKTQDTEDWKNFLGMIPNKTYPHSSALIIAIVRVPL